MPLVLLFAMLAPLFGPRPALAGPAECASVAQAFAALVEIPGYTETLRSADGATRELIVIGSVLYVREGSGWRSKNVARDKRLKFLIGDFDPGAIENCSAMETRAHQGIMARRYRFTLRAAGQPRDVHLSVGLDDGLIREVEFSGERLTLSYDAVMPPR